MSSHLEDCELLEKFCSKTMKLVPREVSQLVVVVARMAKVVGQEEVGLLMDHLEERIHLPSWETTLQHVLRPLARLRPDLGDEEELGRLLGRFQTNCVAAGNGLVGLFPTFSLLSHSCIANTRRCAQDGRVRVRAARPLEEGEELTTSYKCPELGSVARRGHFPTTWFFDCTCSRCCSPTELGSHLSSLLCPLQGSNYNEKDPSHPGKDTSPCSLTADLPRPSCAGGVLTPSFPTEYNSPWSCNSCSFTMSSCQVISKVVLTSKCSCPGDGEAGLPVPAPLPHLPHQPAVCRAAAPAPCQSCTTHPLSRSAGGQKVAI